MKKDSIKLMMDGALRSHVSC